MLLHFCLGLCPTTRQTSPSTFSTCSGQSGSSPLYCALTPKGFFFLKAAKALFLCWGGQWGAWPGWTPCRGRRTWRQAGKSVQRLVSVLRIKVLNHSVHFVHSRRAAWVLCSSKKSAKLFYIRYSASCSVTTRLFNSTLKVARVLRVLTGSRYVTSLHSLLPVLEVFLSSSFRPCWLSRWHIPSTVIAAAKPNFEKQKTNLINKSPHRPRRNSFVSRPVRMQRNHNTQFL